VIFKVYSITLKDTIGGLTGTIAGYTSTITTDAVIMDAIQRLTEPAGEFHYENKGLGNLVINLPGGGDVRDVVWGPKPQMLSYKPHGAGVGCDIVWKVDIALVTCDDGIFDGLFPMEFCYTVQFSIDKSGYQTRTYSGFVRIPQTRLEQGDRLLQRTADKLREQINPQPITGYRRIPGEFTISEDKCRLNFTIRDEQIGPN